MLFDIGSLNHVLCYIFLLCLLKFQEIKSHKKSLDELNNTLNSFNMKINGDETNLSFKDMNLYDSFLKYLSYINFQNLKKN